MAGNSQEVRARRGSWALGSHAGCPALPLLSVGPHRLSSEAPSGRHLHSGVALKGPQLRDHPLHTQKSSGISEGPCGRHLTLQPLQKLLMTSLLPPVPPPLARPPHSSRSDLAKRGSDQVTPCAKPQRPISLRVKAKFFQQRPQALQAQTPLLSPVLSPPPTHSVPTTLAHWAFSDAKHSPTEARPSACSVCPSDSRMTHSTLPGCRCSKGPA